MLTRRNQAFALFLAVFALAFVPVLSAPVRAADPVAAAVAWLHTQQLPDGGFGITSTASAAVTADAVYALALAGEDPGSPAWTVNGHSALDALTALAPAYARSDAGQAGKVARAVAAAGRNPRSFAGMDLIAVIQAAYNPATGRYSADFLFRHAVAIEALQRAKVEVPAAAYKALRDGQLPDGGWFWSFNDAPGKKSDVDTTGRVLQVLGSAPTSACDAGYMRAASYLQSVQGLTGAWAVDASPSSVLNANSTALAVGGLRAIGRHPESAPFVKGGKSGWDALLAFQESSGAFVYSMPADPRTNRMTATTDALAGMLQPLGDSATAGCSRLYLPLILR